MKTFETIHEANKPLYYVSIITATTSVIRNKSGEWSRTNVQLLQSAIYLIAYISLALLSISENKYPFPVLEKSGIIIFITNIYMHGVNVVTISMFVISQIFTKRQLDAIKGIDEMDFVLKKMGLRNALLKSNYLMWKYTIILFLLIFIISFAVSTLMYVMFYDFPIYQFITHTITYIVNTTVKLQYCTWTVVIRERFKILNNLLKSKIKESLFKTKYPVNESMFSKDIEMIVEQHKKLARMARSINLCYSFPLLSYAALNFVVLITQGYILIYSLTFGDYKDPDTQFLVINSLQFLLYTAFELFAIIRYTTLMCFQANYTKDVLHGIRIHPEKIDSRNLVISTSLHLMHDKLEISACRLFNVDFSLLHSICAAVTIYLVIMLQFDIDSTNRTNAKMANVTT